MAVAGWTRPDMLMRYTRAQAEGRAAEEHDGSTWGLVNARDLSPEAVAALLRSDTASIATVVCGWGTHRLGALYAWPGEGRWFAFDECAVMTETDHVTISAARIYPYEVDVTALGKCRHGTWRLPTRSLRRQYEEADNEQDRRQLSSPSRAWNVRQVGDDEWHVTTVG